MARGAIRGKLLRDVIGIRCTAIVGGVTAIAGIGRCVIITVVASSTIIGNSGVCPVQRIIIVVNRERRRFPARSRCVAHGAVRRKAQRYVVGVHGLVKICCMATVTGIGCVGKIAVVTGITVICYGYVRSCERIDGIVVERGRRPGCFSVAGSTICRELRRSVIGHRRLGIITGVTAVTSIRGAVVIAVVTSSAIIGNSSMRSVQCIIIAVDRECGRFPARSRGMTHSTVRREVQRNVVGVRCLVEMRRMTSRTLGGRTYIARRMTFNTIC